MRPRQAYQVLEELCTSCEAQLYRKAVRLSRRDSQTVIEVYQQWYALLLDLGYLHPLTLSRDVRRLLSSMITVDVLSLVSALAECLARIYRKTTRGLKSLCSTVSPHLYSLLREDIMRIDESDIDAARRLIQVFAYMTRLSLNDLDLTKEMIDQYLEVENQLPSSFPDDTVSKLNKIIRHWFSPHPPAEFAPPKHGPGGVAELGRCSIASKYYLLGCDLKLRYAFRDYDDYSPLHNGYPFRRQSKTIFVPKSYKTFRTISMEPATLMYFQQAVLTTLDQQVSRSHYMRNHFGTHDATRNRQLAQAGSFLGSYATLDLSSASDSVSYDLVKRLFRGTWLYRYLICLRSETTLLPNGKTHEMRKFAPMGSALCFPVETIVFSSICELVTRENRVAGDYSVYGDDIILPLCAVPHAVDILTALGFRTNGDKSFVGEDDWFRESCGGEFILGQDVTPLRISRRYASDEDDIRFSALIDLANSAFDRQLLVVRQCFLAKLRKIGCDVYFSPDSLKSVESTNFHLKQRYHRGLQRFEVHCSTIALRNSKKKICFSEESRERIRLYHWLSSSYHMSGLKTSDIWHVKQDWFVEPTSTKVDRTVTVVTHSWRPNWESDLLPV